MESFDPELFKLRDGGKRTSTDREPLPRHKLGEKFLKGPIPWDWISRAAKQPGKAVHVALVLWFLAGIKKCEQSLFCSPS